MKQDPPSLILEGQMYQNGVCGYCVVLQLSYIGRKQCYHPHSDCPATDVSVTYWPDMCCWLGDHEIRLVLDGWMLLLDPSSDQFLYNKAFSTFSRGYTV